MGEVAHLHKTNVEILVSKRGDQEPTHLFDDARRAQRFAVEAAFFRQPLDGRLFRRSVSCEGPRLCRRLRSGCVFGFSRLLACYRFGQDQDLEVLRLLLGVRKWPSRTRRTQRLVCYFDDPTTASPSTRFLDGSMLFREGNVLTKQTTISAASTSTTGQKVKKMNFCWYT